MTMDKRWKPHVSVAAIIKENDQFLLVEEWKNNKLVLNQPAGHWEKGETLINAVIRETLEETGWHFEPTNIVGIYHWNHPDVSGLTYLRFAFCGNLIRFDENYILDDGIENAIWLDKAEIIKQEKRHRSPQLIQCIEDYDKGNRFPLEIIQQVENR